ncbi:heavy metal-responsive transcriptional regulator [Gimesia maris]|uniref:heavy metal-responsive transcriptional regulator n=1 Tax=Gimesia maris TaxID=122 RepID=UPI0030D7030F
MKSFTIGQVAERSGVGIETVRFYEREGLIPKPNRSSSGYRLFDDETIARLQFIRRAKELGFTLNEIKELLSLRLNATTSCADIKSRAEAKITNIDEKIRTLRRMKTALKKLTSQCNSQGSVNECSILDALDSK